MRELELGPVKALSKEKRQQLAAAVRRDPELYNAINGMGGLSEHADIGLLQGTMTQKTEPISGLDVTVKGGTGFMKVVKTNQHGHFKINLNEGTYDVSVIFGEESKTTSFEISNGKTVSFDYDFEKEAVKHTLPPDEVVEE